MGKINTLIRLYSGTPLMTMSIINRLAIGLLVILTLSLKPIIASDGYDLAYMGNLSFDARLTQASVSLSTPLSSLANAKAVACGLNHTVVLLNDGSVWTAGSNVFGQLGDGTFKNRLEFVKIADGVSAIAAGNFHTLLLKNDNTLWACGRNKEGALGDGTLVNRSTPVFVASDVVKLSASGIASSTPTIGQHSAFIKSDGTLWTVGDDSQGQLCDVNSLLTRPTPTLVASSVSDVQCATGKTIYLKTDGTLWGAGLNSNGELGNGTTSNVLAPFQIGSGIVRFWTFDQNLFFKKTNDTVYAVGYVSAFTGVIPMQNFTPVVIPNFKAKDFLSESYIIDEDDKLAATFAPIVLASGVRAFGSSPQNIHWIDSGGHLWLSGNTSQGQLGNGVADAWFTGLRIFDHHVASVSAGTHHFAYVKTDGSLWCAGKNTFGQLGNGSTTDSLEPVKVDDDVVSVAVGLDHTVYLKTDGSLWGMGANRGSLGDGSVAVRTTPVHIADSVVHFDAAGDVTGFVTVEGKLFLMGTAGHGALGDGVTTAHTLTAPYQAATNVRAVYLTTDRSSFVTTDGSLMSIGSNVTGYFGPSYQDVTTPYKLTQGLVTAACGEQNIYLINEANELRVQGSNFRQQVPNLGGTMWTYFDRVAMSDVRAVSTHKNEDATFTAYALVTRLNGELTATGCGLTSSPAVASDETFSVETGLLSRGGSAAINYFTLLQVPTADEIGILRQPKDVVTTAGRTVEFNVQAEAVATVSYTWEYSYDGTSFHPASELPGASGADTNQFAVTAPNGTGPDGIQLRCQVSASNRTDTSAIARLKVPLPGANGRILNLSTRGPAGEGEKTLIGGFSISGTGSKSVLIRVAGPSLEGFGVTKFVANPLLALYRGENKIAEIDDWDPELASTFANAGAFAWKASSKDAAVVVLLQPGSYTVHAVNPTGDASQEALIEIYDLDSAPTAYLTNISCRAYESASFPFILGTVSSGKVNLIARNGGPSLSSFGITTAAQATSIEVYQGADLLSSATSWSANLSALFAYVGAYSYTPGSLDAALVATEVNSVTVHGRTVGTDGLGIVELFIVK